MLTRIEGLPGDVLGIEASGTVTHADYRDVLIPAAEALMKTGPIRLLYLAGQDFAGYALEAMWDDAAFGFSHWHGFERVAMVTENAWLRAVVTMFRPLFPCAVRLFRLDELDVAKAWVSARAAP